MLRADKFLNASVTIWFSCAVVGQFIFAYYIAAFYGGHAVNLDFESWNAPLTHGYVVGQNIGNFTLIVHLLFAFIITVGGPVQFVPYFRRRFPVFHRVNGRIYLLTAFIMSITGLYLGLSGREVAGDPSQQGLLVLGAFLILIFSFLALRTAMARNFRAHRRWALRLFLIANGVWFFRIGLFLWLFINGGRPVGFDMETFQGPFLTVLGFTTYLGGLPLIMLEFYFYAQRKHTKEVNKWIVASLLFAMTIAMIIGTYATFFGMWLPFM